MVFPNFFNEYLNGYSLLTFPLLNYIHCLWINIDVFLRNIMNTIGLIILIVVLLAVLPTWPYSSGWGYYPSGGVGLLVIILIILLLTRGGPV